MCKEYSQLQAPPSIPKPTPSAPSGAVLMCIRCVLIQMYYFKKQTNKSPTTQKHIKHQEPHDKGDLLARLVLLQREGDDFHSPGANPPSLVPALESSQSKGGSTLPRQHNSGTQARMRGKNITVSKWHCILLRLVYCMVAVFLFFNKNYFYDNGIKTLLNWFTNT